MPPDPLVVAETRAWLAKADEDLRASLPATVVAEGKLLYAA